MMKGYRSKKTIYSYILFILLLGIIALWINKADLTSDGTKPSTSTAFQVEETTLKSKPISQQSSDHFPTIVEKYWSKKITQKGDGKTFPAKGDLIKMHYTAYVGKMDSRDVFDTTRATADQKPLAGFIGVGMFIRGWDEGVITMSLGERAVLEIEPKFAYGSKGHAPLIPPNSVITFDLELVEIIPQAEKRKKEKQIVYDTFSKIEQKNRYSQAGIYS